MFAKELNNAELWSKIQKLRDLIKLLGHNFHQRTCWNCKKDLNIYDFLSDNLEFTPQYILKLWQSPILEFHCCDCFKQLKIKEIKKIEHLLNTRYCSNCGKRFDIYSFTKHHSYLKIKELEYLWLNQDNLIFCSGFCEKFYYKTKLG